MSKISENVVFEFYKNGLPKDFDLNSNKIVRRKNKELPLTIQISIKFEFDLLSQIKELAEKNGLPYQTFMKKILKDYLKNPNIDENLKQINEKINSLERKIKK
jgi:predicted DNA binding CopG/RHH family protein